ncbi:uncharacterized protein KQ657_001920 [Scheffersomyces spartinae]|uniref:Glycosidase n=1 Tax=Scheffersomyces spartinae TaxID=45513 RepID=A0A9P7V6M9_9ASCO|nr:uncharacterized protein KQ657_001920 [Scheffersomyces spartinae]KAG7192202.1 hypothetical protein KQ657_001920 [Scheffersomyces spartinae]
MKFPSINRNSPAGSYVPPKAFPIGPFHKYPHNPILVPDPNIDFESGYLYNAAAIVVDKYVFLLYRAQDKVHRTSTIGLAWSDDGFNFTKLTYPIITPTEKWELGGGCEDPRIVRHPVLGQFIVTYTSYDRYVARLCVAVLDDLLHWTKYPSLVPDSWIEVSNDRNGQPKIRHLWSKLGAIFTERNPVDGKYYMIWGDASLHLAHSDDCIHWLLPGGDSNSNTFTSGILTHEDYLVESGPPPIKLDNGKNQWVFFYNASTAGKGRLPKGTYSVSQMLVDYDIIKLGPVARLEQPFLIPEASNEITGQVNKVVFCEGLVQFKDKWLLYFGQGDSHLGVAIANIK